MTKEERRYLRARPTVGGLIVVGLIALAAARPARAERAADLIQEGVSLRRKGDDEGALRRFQRAYELDKSARAQGQMGLAEQALGRWIQAHEDLTRALEAASDPWIEKNATTLRDALAVVGEHVGKLEILGGSPGAEVSVDGVARGKLPLSAPLILPTGPVIVRLSAGGLTPVQRSTQIRAHQVARESFDPLAAVAPPPAEPAATPIGALPPAVPGRAASPEAPPPPPPAERGGPSKARASAKWIAWGGAAVALGVGVVGYVNQSGATRDFNDNCMVDGSGTVLPATGKPVTSDQCRGWRGQRDNGFALELGGFIGFAAAAAAGVVLWLTEPAPAGGTQAAWRACAPSVGAGGAVALDCGWRF